MACEIFLIISFTNMAIAFDNELIFDLISKFATQIYIP